MSTQTARLRVVRDAMAKKRTLVAHESRPRPQHEEALRRWFDEHQNAPTVASRPHFDHNWVFFLGGLLSRQPHVDMLWGDTSMLWSSTSTLLPMDILDYVLSSLLEMDTDVNVAELTERVKDIVLTETPHARFSDLRRQTVPRDGRMVSYHVLEVYIPPEELSSDEYLDSMYCKLDVGFSDAEIDALSVWLLPAK